MLVCYVISAHWKFTTIRQCKSRCSYMTGSQCRVTHIIPTNDLTELVKQVENGLTAVLFFFFVKYLYLHHVKTGHKNVPLTEVYKRDKQSVHLRDSTLHILQMNCIGPTPDDLTVSTNVLLH